MRTRLCRTCHAVVLGICNSREEATSSTAPALLTQRSGSVALWGFMRTRLHRTCHTVVLGICNSREEATPSTLHLQLQLSHSNGLVAWHCKVSCEPVCAELATQSFSASVTRGFPSAQISLHFDWKWRPPAVQPHHSHEDGRCRCIPGFESCQTTSVSMLEEVDPYETVFWRSAEHWCMNLFSRTRSRKSFSHWETSFMKIAEPGGKYR
jgi:hypothetical protein